MPKAKTIQKQISMWIDLPTWRAMRHEAARRHIPITELARQLMRQGGLETITRSAESSAG